MEIAVLAAYILESSTDDEHEDDIRSARPSRNQRSVWTKNWLKLREKEGFGVKLLRELRTEEPTLYRNFLRMCASQFDYLLGLVGPHIQKQNTKMRTSISAEVRLVLTLRFLATGENFRSLQYLFRISQPAISSIIPQVLDAIFNVLASDFIRV